MSEIEKIEEVERKINNCFDRIEAALRLHAPDANRRSRIENVIDDEKAVARAVIRKLRCSGCGG